MTESSDADIAMDASISNNKVCPKILPKPGDIIVSRIILHPIKVSEMDPLKYGLDSKFIPRFPLMAEIILGESEL